MLRPFEEPHGRLPRLPSVPSPSRNEHKRSFAWIEVLFPLALSFVEGLLQRVSSSCFPRHRHLLDHRRQMGGDDRRRSLSNTLETAPQRRPEPFRIADGFTVATHRLSQFTEIRSRIEKPAFIIPGGLRRALGIGSFQARSSGAVRTIRENNREEGCFVMRRAPERRQGSAKHEEAVARDQYDVAFRASELGAEGSAAPPAA